MTVVGVVVLVMVMLLGRRRHGIAGKMDEKRYLRRGRLAVDSGCWGYGYGMEEGDDGGRQGMGI